MFEDLINRLFSTKKMADRIAVDNFNLNMAY